jgi:hypothetical protein
MTKLELLTLHAQADLPDHLWQARLHGAQAVLHGHLRQLGSVPAAKVAVICAEPEVSEVDSKYRRPFTPEISRSMGAMTLLLSVLGVAPGYTA